MSVELGFKWSDVAVLPQVIPAGDYTLRLLGGKKEDDGRTTVSNAVSEGELTGKPFRFSFPNFTEQEWARSNFKQLSIALGMDIQDGEEPSEYLNRAAGQTYGLTIFHSKYKDKVTDEEKTSAKPKLSSFRIA